MKIKEIREIKSEVTSFKLAPTDKKKLIDEAWKHRMNISQFIVYRLAL